MQPFLDDALGPALTGRPGAAQLSVATTHENIYLKPFFQLNTCRAVLPLFFLAGFTA